MAQKVAFITGGNRGLGYQTALDLGLAGVEIVLGSRDADKGQKAATKLRDAGVHAEVLKFDITTPFDCQAAYDYFDTKYGRLDILVNNAGIADGSLPGVGPENCTSQVSSESLHRIFETNFFAQVELTNLLLPLIRKSEAGRIVNVSSILGSLTMQADTKEPKFASRFLAYDASKTALNAYTIHLAWELKDTRIKVNSAHPGWVKTEMGGPNAPLELSEGSKTSVALALLPEDGPTGGFFHLGLPVPW